MPYHEQAYGWRVCRNAVAISMAMAAERNAVQLYLDSIGQALMEHHIRKNKPKTGHVHIYKTK